MDTRDVWIIQHSAQEPAGFLTPAVEAEGIRLRWVRPFAGEAVPQQMGDAAGLVVLGGPMGVGDADRFSHLRDEMALIENALRLECPILGICLGSQLLAATLGGAVRKGPRKEIGWHRVTLSENALHDPLFKGLESSFIAFHWHGDIFDLPTGAASLARSQLTEVQAFRHGASAYGLLFHMEPTAEIVKAMAGAFPKDMADAGTTEGAILEGAREHLAPLSERARRVFGAWAERVVTR